MATTSSVVIEKEKIAQSYERYTEIADLLLSRTKHRPAIGIIAGSGLGDIAEQIDDAEYVDYKDIPYFPQPTAHGHRGRFVFGVLGGKSVVCMQGRVHTYEGYSASECAVPVRVMKIIGVTTLFIANAAGGLNQQFRPGDIMMITDHVCFPALAGTNVLTGTNDERFGPRFPDMSTCYTPKLADMARTMVATMGMGWRFQEGSYMMMAGPAYATKAECKLLKLLGGDAVGMSNCWEIMAAHHCNMRTFAVCVITDVHKDPGELLTHEEVLKVSEQSSKNVAELFVGLIKLL